MRNEKKRRKAGRWGSSQRADAAFWAGVARLGDLNQTATRTTVDDGLSWVMMQTRYQRHSGLAERALAVQQSEAA